MTPIESYFVLPIRIFDPYLAKQARKSFEEHGEIKKVAHVKGVAYLPLGEIHLWMDSYLPHRELSDVRENGFDSVLVMTKTQGEYLCSWTMINFLQEYGSYLERMEEHLEQQEQKDFVRNVRRNIEAQQMMSKQPEFDFPSVPEKQDS